jgi:hypothetical protein
MTLYHGTNVDFDLIDIEKSNPYKDFGKGFYLTDIKEQAERMALRKVKFFGGVPVIQVYDFDEGDLQRENLKVKFFSKPSEEWAVFIHNNRNRTLDFRHDYDVVIGQIANDGVAYLLGRYEEGTITLPELVRGLEYKQLNNQYFFGTQKALDLLRRV